MHVSYTHHETYDQGVKLFCMERGGAVAPMQVFAAITPLGEADGAYKVYELPLWMNDVPADVKFQMIGNTASYTFKISVPVGGDEPAYAERVVTTRFAFSGDYADPTIAASYSISP